MTPRSPATGSRSTCPGPGTWPTRRPSGGRPTTRPAAVMRHDFWVARHGRRRLGRGARRLPAAARTGSRAADDFADLLWEVFGELGTSHAYVRPAADGGGDGGPVGLLGADLERDEDGSWRMTRVLPAETSDPRARSPLAAPGVVVRPGRPARGGRPAGGPGDRAGPAAGRRGGHAGGADRAARRRRRVRRVVVRAAGRRRAGCATRTGSPAGAARVRELGGGRLGYLHIPDMVAGGWAEFHRDLRLRDGAGRR